MVKSSHEIDMIKIRSVTGHFEVTKKVISSLELKHKIQMNYFRGQTLHVFFGLNYGESAEFENKDV